MPEQHVALIKQCFLAMQKNRYCGKSHDHLKIIAYTINHGYKKYGKSLADESQFPELYG